MQTVQLTSDAEPTAAKNSQTVVGVSQRTVENGNPNKDNNPKASSDKRAKKAERLAALEKDFTSKMRLKKIEFELKRKELEMEMQLFEEEGALKLEYEKEALDARAPDSDDSAAPHRNIPDSKKMSHLKTLLTGKAKSAISGMGYSGEFYAQAWELLGRATLPNCRRSA